MLIITPMSGHKLIILKELFPLHHKKIVKLMGYNPDLHSIIDDLLECHQVLTGESAAHIDAAVPREYWEGLYEDLKNEAIDLINREMTSS